jgi:hypothetical protein
MVLLATVGGGDSYSFEAKVAAAGKHQSDEAIAPLKINPFIRTPNTGHRTLPTVTKRLPIEGDLPGSG